jgi:Cu/Ag efflux protein CusF
MKIGGVLSLVAMLFVAAPTWAQSNKVMRASGRVTSVAADTVAIQAGASTMTFAVDAQTKVEGKGVGTKARAMKSAPAVSDLVTQADSVTVEYHDMGGGKLHAAKIKIVVKSFKK